MARKRARSSGARTVTPEASNAGPAESLWPLLLILAAGVIVFAGALPYFFAQDDFAALARASGISPRLTGPWRYLSGQLYFDVMWRLAGLQAWAYHLISLVAHLGSALLLHHLMARRLSRPASLLGAVLFVTHPALYTTLYSVSGIGEVLSLLFALAALRLAVVPNAWRWSAIPVFALSLLSKESTLLFPLAMVLGFGVLPRERGRAGGMGWILLAVAAAYAAYLASADLFRVREGLSGSAAYALGDGADMGRNLLTYLGWTLNAFLPTVQGFGDAVDPAVFPWGIALAIVWLVGLLSPTLRSRGWGVAGITYLLLLLPVLPLRNHTYHYYLYAPLAAAAWALAGAFDGLAVTRLGWRSGMATAGALAALLTLNGALLVRKVEHMPFMAEEMRADPTVDRARIARNLYRSLQSASLPRGTRLQFWSPALAVARSDPSRHAAEAYWASNVQSALFDGLGVRVMFPQVTEATFVEVPAPNRADRIAAYRRDGMVRVTTAGEIDSLLRLYPPAPAPAAGDSR